MTRGTATLDRLVTRLVAIVLILFGALLIVWELGRWISLPQRTHTAWRSA